MPGTFRGENAYLHALSYDRLYHLVMADDPAGARAAGDWWQQTFHRLRAAETAIAECRRVTDGHLGGASGAAFRAGLDRLAAPIQLAQDNAHVWWAAADALVHAQAQMAELHEAGISAEGRRLQAVAIAYDLAERYTNLGLDLLPPVPQHGTARPEHRYGASISLAGHTSTPATTAPAAVLATPVEPPPPVPVAPVATTSISVPIPPDVSEQPASHASVSAMPVPCPITTPEPPPTHQLFASALTPRPLVLLGRDQFARATADLLVDDCIRAAGPEPGPTAIVVVRGTNDTETRAMLAAVRVHVNQLAAALSHGPRPVTALFALAEYADPDALRAGLADLAAACPTKRTRRGAWAAMVAKIRHKVRGPIPDPPTWLPVLFMVDLGNATPAVADAAVEVMSRLARGPQPARFVVALTSSKAIGSDVLHHVHHVGFDLPPLTRADIERLLGGAEQPLAGQVAWTPAHGVEVAARPAVRQRVADRLAKRSARLPDRRDEADAARVIWLWRLYLRVFDPGGMLLSEEEESEHAMLVLTIAEIAERWQDLRRYAVTSSGRGVFAQLVPTVGDDGAWASALAAGGLAGPEHASGCADLRELLCAHEGRAGQAALLLF